MKTKILKSVILIAVMVTALSSSSFAEIKIRQQVDMQGNYITNLAAPTKLDHAVPKSYVDYLFCVPGKLSKPGNGEGVCEGETGIPWPNPRFTDNGDGTVTDNLTGLIWSQDGSPWVRSNWDTAIDNCNNFNAGGRDDWRLPNIKEMHSIMNFSKSFLGNWFNSSATPFTGVANSYYWSSTTAIYDSGVGWYAYFINGEISTVSKSSEFYAWPVCSRR